MPLSAGAGVARSAIAEARTEPTSLSGRVQRVLSFMGAGSRDRGYAAAPMPASDVAVFGLHAAWSNFV